MYDFTLVKRKDLEKMTKISCDLESERAKELDTLLTLIKPKIIDYVEKSDPKDPKYEIGSLGTYQSPEFLKSQFTENNDLDKGIKGDNEKLFDTIDQVLKYSVNTWNPGFLDKLYASSNPIGVISDLVLSILNTNSHVYTVSPVLSVLENYIGRKYAQLFFEDDKDTCGGLTFSGGSWSNITSMQIARALKYPDTKEKGNGKYKFAIYTSEHCHYSVIKGAILLGLGSLNVFKIKILGDGSMDVKDLEKVMGETVEQGYTPLYINATAGTTVFGSFDPFEEISKVAKKYDSWFHIDGSWGGNVVFSETHKTKLKGSKLADSVTVNPHKMLGIPTTCSFLLLPHVLYFQKSMSLAAPYLFHGRESYDDDIENFDLADGTMGCGRRADSFKFYMGWLYYGQEGFAKRVDHAFEIAEDFIQKISKNPNFKLVIGNEKELPACLQVCFYYKPDGFVGNDYTEITRFISRELHKRGKYLVDFSPNPTDKNNKGEFFRVVFNSPILTDTVVDDLINSIIEVGAEYKK